MENNLVILPEKFGIEEKKANELYGNLPQIKAERAILEQQYNEIITLDIEHPTTGQLARELRIKIKDNRTKGIEPWHKNTKEFLLKGGQFVDAIRRMEVDINERMEKNLEQIENHLEIKEAQIRNKVDLLVSQINKYMAKIADKLEIETKITTYSARHSFASVLRNSGVNVSFISQSLGHKNISTTQSYLDSLEEEDIIKNATHLNPNN